jgi:hypothetical protein
VTPAEQRAYDRLIRIADGLEPGLQVAWRRAVEQLRGSLDFAAAVSALERGNVDALLALLFDTPSAQVALAGLRRSFAEALVTAIPPTMRALPPIGPLRLRVAAPVLNPELVTAVRQWEDAAFRRVVAEMREGVRAVVADGVARGAGPRTLVSTLRSQTSAVGLTAYDARLLASFREQLRTDPSTALRRALRDRRFDRTVRKGDLTEAQIDRMAEAYRAKLVTWRAETFARSASVQAANEASVVAWAELIRTGNVDEANVRRFWVVADDERTCPRCAPIPALNPDGVGLREAFRTPVDGLVLQPTIHPNCRCTVWVRLLDAAERGQPARPAPGAGAFTFTDRDTR